MFQKAIETLDLAQNATLGGLTRKLADIEDHICHGGRVLAGGCLVVQAARKGDYRVERAIDLLSCLPDHPKGAALVLARYCPPNMLDDYPAAVRQIERCGLREVAGVWDGWTDEMYWSSGHFIGRFWKRARARRVLGRMI
jgi:hypothetical protein